MKKGQCPSLPLLLWMGWGGVSCAHFLLDKQVPKDHPGSPKLSQSLPRSPFIVQILAQGQERIQEKVRRCWNIVEVKRQLLAHLIKGIPKGDFT